MELSIAVNDFVKQLQTAARIADKKTTMPILGNVLIETSGNGQIHLTATDLELGIRCTCAANIEKKGRFTVPARRLLNYTRLLSADQDLQIKVSPNDWASFVCGRSRTRIAGHSPESFPELPEPPSCPLATLPIGILSRLIERTSFAISEEESRFTLNGALLLLSDTGVQMVATDGHRLALSRISHPMPGIEEVRVLVPKKALAELRDLASKAEGQDVVFSLSDNHLFFHLDKHRFLSRKLSGNFPDYQRVLPKEQPYCVTVGRDDLVNAVSRAANFSDERSRGIRLRFHSGCLTVRAERAEVGESEDDLSIEYSGPELEIGLNAQYIADFLRAVDQPSVDLSFKDSNSAFAMRPHGSAENSEYRYFVMPMRL